MVRRILIIVFFICIASNAFGFNAIKEIPVPEGYARIQYNNNSFSAYLQSLPLKQDNTIKKYNGKKVFGLLYNIYAVVNKPLLFNANLEQCADFCMRFWADFHKERNNLNALFLYDYSGNKKYYKNSNKNYKSYLKWHMGYSNSYSIKKGAKQVNGAELRPGDMFVQNKDGGIGHVSMIVDAAKNEEGKAVYLMGYGFIPAQEFHIEKATKKHGVNGWFTKEGYETYLSEYFGGYGKPAMRRF